MRPDSCMPAYRKTAQELFFKYAFPCSNVLVDMNAIPKERFDNLKVMFEEGELPEKDILEDTFKAAFRRLKVLSKEMGIADYWDLRVIKEYWQNGNHNKNIDEGEGNYSKFPLAFNDFCKVHVAEVISKKENMLIIKYGNTIRPVFNTLVKDADIGDKVRIHHAYAIEKV